MQPPSCGCVLKLKSENQNYIIEQQPPSCGCVLKHTVKISITVRLYTQPPSCGCVLKQLNLDQDFYMTFAAAFVRLCVETANRPIKLLPKLGSRLRAAVC